jgi:hypothetical protein
MRGKDGSVNQGLVSSNWNASHPDRIVLSAITLLAITLLAITPSIIALSLGGGSFYRASAQASPGNPIVFDRRTSVTKLGE